MFRYFRRPCGHMVTETTIVKLLAVYEDNINGRFECVFTACLNTAAICKLYIALYTCGLPVGMAFRAICTQLHWFLCSLHICL